MVCRTIVGVLLLLAVLAVPAEARKASSFSRSSQRKLQLQQKQHAQRHRELVASLKKLAAYCDEKGFTEAAAKIRRLGVPMDSRVLRVDSLPKQVQPKIPPSLPADERYWRSQLRHLQKQYAKDVYMLSRRVLRSGFPSYAYQLVREAAFHDPDHEPARRVLGYVRYGNAWVTPFAAGMMRRRYEWHDKFGWLRTTHVARYERGERNFQGRWMSAAQEAVLRQDFRNAWEIRTDHFLVKTNSSLERGVEVAWMLENFYHFFHQTFAGFFSTPQQMQKLFEGAGSSTRKPTASRPFAVHYYRSRDEYIRRLQAKIPQIAITNGLYYTTDRTSYFYHDPQGNNDNTLFHEATHQLFYESESAERAIATDENFWIVEGIACYMESFEQNEGRFSLGDPRYIRFEAARYRLLSDQYYVPLAKFSRMGMQAFQSDPQISKNYSQASGLAHFFMHYDGGRYRDALVEHLSEIYRSRRRRLNVVPSLAELTGVDFPELDRQYAEYTKQIDDNLQRNGAVSR